MLDRLLDWDRNILIYLNNLGSEAFDPFWIVVNKFATWTPIYVIIIFLLFWKSAFKKGLWRLLSYLSMLLMLLVTVYSVKALVGRLRPVHDQTINTLIRGVVEVKEYSFFSGHAAASFAIVALGVLFLRKQFPWIAFIWIFPLLFSYSRLYLGVHYLSDVLVGAVVGSIFAFIFYRMYQKFREPYIL